MARQGSGATESRFFGSAGPAGLALSAFGTAALVPALLITIIMNNAAAIIVCLAAILLVVWLTLRALRTGYRLDGSVLTSTRSSRGTASSEIDLRQIVRTGRQRRDRLELKMSGHHRDSESDTPTALDLGNLSLDSAVRLRSVMVSEFGIDCATWGVTGSERARRDTNRDARPASTPK